MVAFNGTFDPELFQECLSYVQDSLNWLIASEEESYRSQISTFSPDALDQTIATLENLMRCQFYRLHNIRSRINRIPSELLSQIFLCLQDPLATYHGALAPSSGPPPPGLWHRASAVCRHWRQGVLNTPGLWTVIRTPRNGINYQWTDTWLSRSGALPLTVTSWGHDEGVYSHTSHLLSKGRRIMALCLMGVDILNLDKTLKQLQLADQLEKLMVVYADIPREHNSSPYELPQLQALSIGECTIWRSWSVRQLRYLSLTDQQWKPEDVREFFVMLAANPHLEELILSGIRTADRRSWIEAHHVPIHLPRLRRLLSNLPIHNSHRYTDAMVLTLNKTLVLSPSCTRFYVLQNGYIGLDMLSEPAERATAYPAKRMLLVPKHLMMTDGVSVHVHQNMANYIPPLPYICHAQVDELWLFRTAENMYFDLGQFVASASSIAKLVIQSDVSSWLDMLRSSTAVLPALKELHILAPTHCDRQAIIRFLTHRKQAGLRVDILRFVSCNPPLGDDEAFNDWQVDSSEFRSLATRVTFEQVASLRLVPFVSAEFGLPEACEHPSPTSIIWQPWYHHVLRYPYTPARS